MNLHERLRDELTHEVGADARARHLSAARAARLLHGDASAVPAATGRRPQVRAARRLGAGLAAFGLLAVPSAAMAQDALPGDLLYPVKLAAEPLQSLFDGDVVARHRADEVAELLADDSTPSEALERAMVRAEEALADSDASDTARARVAEAREKFEARRAEQEQARADREAEAPATGVGKDGSPGRQDDRAPGHDNAPGTTGDAVTDDVDAPAETHVPQDAGRPEDKPSKGNAPADAGSDKKDADDEG